MKIKKVVRVYNTMEKFEDMFLLQSNSQNANFVQNTYNSASFDISKITHASLTNGVTQ
jgi:hypothetical protein